MARRQRDSSGYEKARVKVVKLHDSEKVANRQKDYQHKLSRKLVEEYDAIYLEDLNVAGMVKNHNLAKSISGTALGQFTRFIAYKGSGTDAGRFSRPMGAINKTLFSMRLPKQQPQTKRPRFQCVE